MLDNLTPGAVIKGKVKNITDFGAFIDLDGLDGRDGLDDLRLGLHGHRLVLGDLDDLGLRGLVLGEHLVTPRAAARAQAPNAPATTRRR